jgi:hypothetical protein
MSVEDGRLMMLYEAFRGFPLVLRVTELSSSSVWTLVNVLKGHRNGKPSCFFLEHRFGPPESWQLAHAPLKKSLTQYLAKAM